jgi:amidase
MAARFHPPLSPIMPFTGVPVPIKDLNMVPDVRQTLGSEALRDNVALADDNVVTRLRDAGSIMLGKTATPEFGLPYYTETKIGPPARTPGDLSRSAGGSIRIPSSVCGLFGIKHSRNRVSQGPPQAGPGRARRQRPDRPAPSRHALRSKSQT